jgi:hypothetical protein
MVYNSWLAMQQVGETDPDTCAYNDLALVKIDPADVGSVNPSIPNFGGPVGLNTSGTAAGDKVYSYGNSSLRQGITLLSPKQGFSLGDHANGNALGVLSTVAIAPLPASNGVGDVAKEIAWANSKGGQSISLVKGTEPFKGGLLPI